MTAVRWTCVCFLLSWLFVDAAHVVVVGSGFAGLGAATQLEADGHNVTLLEARPRLGGRAFTDKTSFRRAIDMGPMWIHGIKNNPVYELAQKYNVKTMTTDYDNLKLFGPTGTPVPDAAVETLYDTLAKKIDKIRNNADVDMSLGAAMEKAFEKLKLSKDQQELMRFKICDEVELDYATSIYNLSGYWFDNDDNLKGGDVLITDPNGYSAIVDPVASALRDVRLSTTVQRVEYKSTGVEVHTNGGVISADYAVITASLGTLKRELIEFQPALPKALTNAISRLGCGVSDKVVLQFPKGSSAAWGGGALDVFYHIAKETTHHGEFTENWNMKHYMDEDMILSFSVGQRDWALLENDQNTTRIAAEALAALRTAYPTLPEPEVVGLHRWGDDPLASCTWSSIPVGATPKDTKQFLKGAGSGRLLFAGEHTTTHLPGTTHGAWKTGLSAANAIKAHAEQLTFDSDTVAELRMELHKPHADDIVKRRPLRRKSREWKRQSMASEWV